MAKRSVSPLLGGALVKLLELPAGRLGGLLGRFLERAGTVGACAAASELSGGTAPLMLAAAVAIWGVDGLKQRSSAEEAARRKREDARKAERIRGKLEAVADDVHSMHELLLELVRGEQETSEARTGRIGEDELAASVRALVEHLRSGGTLALRRRLFEGWGERAPPALARVSRGRGSQAPRTA